MKRGSISIKWLLSILFCICIFQHISVLAAYPTLGVKVSTPGNAISSRPSQRSAEGRNKRPWVPADSTRVRYFVSNQSQAASSADKYGESPIVPSPNGEYFFFIFRYGDLSTDSVVYELHVFSALDLQDHLMRPKESDRSRPLHKLVVKTTNTAQAGISDAHWESAHSILFRRSESNSNHQLYRLEIGTGELVALTDPSHNVGTFAVRRNSVIYLASQRGEMRSLNKNDKYPAIRLEGRDLMALLQPYNWSQRIYASYKGSVARLVGIDRGRVLLNPWISPDGKWAIVVYLPANFSVPDKWKYYDARQRAGSVFSLFMLVNLKNGSARPVVEAPTGLATNVGMKSIVDVLWSNDSKRAIIVNTALPIEESQPQRSRTAYIVDYEVSSGNWSPIESMSSEHEELRVDSVKLAKSGDLLIIRKGGGKKHADARVYKFVGDRWVRHKGPASQDLPLSQGVTSRPGPLSVPARKSFELGAKVPLSYGLTAELRQDANSPPAIVVSNGKRDLTVTCPDPALDGIWRAPMREVQWREMDGKLEVGGLMLPRDDPKGRPWPLVIQAYHYLPGQFLPDGPFHAAYAAQSLAAGGVAVLYMNTPRSNRREVLADVPHREGPMFVERIDAAVDQLAADGLIDPRRIGLVGFSRAGYEAYYAITHPGRTKIAAAVIADSGLASYGEYVAAAAFNGIGHPGFEKLYGGGSFWENKHGWLTGAPSFNVDKLKTPVLFSYSGTSIMQYIIAIEQLGAFRANKKAVEFILFPGANHELHLPRQRLTSLQFSLDWFTFWLTGREFPDAAKADMYMKWRAMRDENNHYIDTEQPPAANR